MERREVQFELPASEKKQEASKEEEKVQASYFSTINGGAVNKWKPLKFSTPHDYKSKAITNRWEEER